MLVTVNTKLVGSLTLMLWNARLRLFLNLAMRLGGSRPTALAAILSAWSRTAVLVRAATSSR